MCGKKLLENVRFTDVFGEIAIDRFQISKNWFIGQVEIGLTCLFSLKLTKKYTTHITLTQIEIIILFVSSSNNKLLAIILIFIKLLQKNKIPYIFCI